MGGASGRVDRSGRPAYRHPSVVKGVDPRMAGKRFIHEFLNELEINEELSELYGNDPTAAMESYGLDAEQQDLLRDGSTQEIRAELRREMKTHVAYVIRMG